MGVRMTITFICDKCGRLSIHEQFARSGFGEIVATTLPQPFEWYRAAHGGGEFRDYCHTCKPKHMRDDTTT